MKLVLVSIAAIFSNILLPTAHADTFYNLTNGTLSLGNTSGTFSGTFALDASGNITSASFTILEDGQTFVDNIITNTAILPPPGYTSYSGDATAFVTQVNGGPPEYVSSSLDFSVLETADASPILCAGAVCANGVPTNFAFEEIPPSGPPLGGPTIATGGTITLAANPPATPEPSSLFLLGTGAFGMLLLRGRPRFARSTS